MEVGREDTPSQRGGTFGYKCGNIYPYIQQYTRYIPLYPNYTRICPIIGHFRGLGSDLSRGSPRPRPYLFTSFTTPLPFPTVFPHMRKKPPWPNYHQINQCKRSNAKIIGEIFVEGVTSYIKELRTSKLLARMV